MLQRYSLPHMKKVWSEKNKYEKWLEIEIAVCQAKAEMGKIPKKAADKITKRAEVDLDRIKKIEEETRHDMLAFVESINERIGSEARYVHQGLTSSDVKDTARALQMKETLELLENDLEELIQITGKMALKHKKTIMIGRTHGVHAEPITWGLKLALWHEELNRHLKRIQNLFEIVSVGQISGAVGTYTSVSPEIEKKVCDKLGLKSALITNQILQRDRQADFLNNLALIAASLEKFATEIRNLQRTDILEVEEGFRSGQKGSSAMPHKKNPIVCERITGLARVVRGNVIPGLENIALWHERDLTHSSVERVVLPDSSILVDYMLQKFKMVLNELKVNKDNMKDNLNRTHGLIFSQRLMLALMDKGLKREKAYEMAQHNALAAWENERDYKELIIEDEEIKKYLDKEEIENIFNYDFFIKEIDRIYKRLGFE
ncbi:MAG: adenylosuccinate lyase [Halanaerobiales bacterium]